MGKQGFREITKTTKFIKGYKGQEIMETHNHQRPEGTQTIEESGIYRTYWIGLFDLLGYFE